MKRSILLWGNPTLNTRCREIEPHEMDMARGIVDDLFDTLYANGGVGLSAIQIGAPFAIFVMDAVGGKVGQRIRPVALINPAIMERIGDQEPMEEGCLSAPGIFEEVLRYPEVVVSYLTPEGETKLVQFDELEAHCAQHEMEHAEGQLFVQKFGPVKRDQLKRKMQKHLRRTRG